MKKTPITVEVDPEVLRELEYIVELHRKYGAPKQCDSVSDLLEQAARSIATGSRRPGAWERQLIQMMGLIAQCDEHNIYRAHAGKPNTSEVER